MNNAVSRETLLSKLTALDFMAVDLGLYLNIHSDDSEAIKEYNNIIEAANIVRMKYEEMYGPLTSFRSYAMDTCNWQWKDNPWPWENCFNYLIEEGCE